MSYVGCVHGMLVVEVFMGWPEVKRLCLSGSY
jgi:hypothetical protein